MHRDVSIWFELLLGRRGEAELIVFHFVILNNGRVLTALCMGTFYYSNLKENKILLTFRKSFPEFRNQFRLQALVLPRFLKADE